MRKNKLLLLLVLLVAVVSGAWANDFTINIPSLSNGSVVAKVGDAVVTSAASGATVSLVATPDAGYRLKSISGTFKGGPVETLTNSGGSVNGTYFSLSASNRQAKGWNLVSNSTITITSKADGLKIDKAEFNKQWQGNSFDIGDLKVSPGTLSLNGNTITVSSVNNNSFTLTGPGNGANSCRVNSVTICGSGIVVDRTQTITSTDAPNVKTFTMPESDITISAEFERVNVSSVSLSQTEAAMTVGGDALTLTATVAPDDDADKTVTWTTSDASVATVTDGVVTAVGAGTATITATATNGTDDTSDDKTATCAVTVAAEPATYSVTMKDGVKDADKWTVKVGEGQAQALPIGGLKGDGSEKVTLQYNGRLKVKGVKATSDAAATAAAEGHALSASVVGEIVGSDGMAYAAVDKDNLPSGVTAVAMVCYVDGNDHGLALAMADVQDKKMSWDNNRGANDGKTAAEWCTGWNTSHPITGATWLLASKTQWNNMISAAGSASNLSNAFSAVVGTNLQAFSYWSSTPNIGTSAWRYYFPSSSWSWTYLNQDNTGSYVRACLEW